METSNRQVRFVLIGYGWRADFFYRIVKEAPEDFMITAAVLRTKERAEEVAKKYQVFATDQLDEALETNPDFVVLCVPRNIVTAYLKKIMDKGVPILCETPPGRTIEELNDLWDYSVEKNGHIKVIEQYYVQPLYSAWLQVIQSGKIGPVSNIHLSALHGYHAMSIFRKVLNVGFENCHIEARQFEFEVTATNSRAGYIYDGEVKMVKRTMATLEFDSKKVAFLDFSGEQYHSTIRTRRLNIQGLRGEINDFTIRYLNDENVTVTSALNRIDEGIYNNSHWSHLGIMLGEEYIYRNPFQHVRLNDDEIAIATCLKDMKTYVSALSRQEDLDVGYSLSDALQDTYLAFMIEEAIEKGEKLTTQHQQWAKESYMEG